MRHTHVTHMAARATAEGLLLGLVPDEWLRARLPERRALAIILTCRVRELLADRRRDAARPPRKVARCCC